MHKWITIGLILITTATTGFCQNQIVRYSDLLKDIYESKKDSVYYRNVIFKDDVAIQDKASFLTYLNSLRTTKDANGYFLVNKRIQLVGCTFESDLFFIKTVFNKRVYFDENKFPNKAAYAHRLDNAAYLRLDSCVFNTELLIVSFNTSFPVFTVDVTSCRIHHAFWYLRMSNVNIHRSEFTERFKVGLENNSSIRVDSSRFTLHSTYDSHINNEEGTGATELIACSFTGDEGLVFEFNSSSKETVIEENTFDVHTQVSLRGTALTLSKNTFNKKLGLDVSNIDESVFIDTRSLKELEFGLFIDENFGNNPVWRYYDGSTHEDIADAKMFKGYFRTYKILFDYFRLIGDIQSANMAYVKIRELDGRIIHLNYHNTPSFKNFFSLALNKLLKLYTAYGTDPARALLISFYIVLLFGIFYFFFPSDWDVTSKSMLLERFKTFIEKNDKGYVKPFLRLLLGFTVSFINAATLSLNAFTTLGFGNIPTHGIARYVCVMQGFIGWFLLSIFTVALINQAQF